MQLYLLVLFALYQSIAVLAVPVSSSVNNIGSNNHGQVENRRLHKRSGSAIKLLRNCVGRACLASYQGLENSLGRANQAFARHAKEYPDLHKAAVGLAKGVGTVSAGIAGNTLAALGLDEYLNRQEAKAQASSSASDEKSTA